MIVSKLFVSLFAVSTLTLGLGAIAHAEEAAKEAPAAKACPAGCKCDACKDKAHAGDCKCETCKTKTKDKKEGDKPAAKSDDHANHDKH